MKIRITRPDVQVPFYAKHGDAGFDLRAAEEIMILTPVKPTKPVEPIKLIKLI